MSRPPGTYPFSRDLRMGVYRITSLNNGATYIGSAKNFYSRWRRHLNDLKRGTHSNSQLSRIWAKYGITTFRWEVIEVVDDPAKLLEIEQRWLDWLFRIVRADLVINTCQVAGSNLGRRWSQETRKRMSEAAKQRGNTCPHDDAWRRQVSEANQRNVETRCGPVFRSKMAVLKKGNTYTKGLKYLHKEGVNKGVRPEDIALYLADGWLFGRV